MASTVLSLIQRACYEAQIPNVPVSLVGQTNTGVLQLLNLFYSIGQDLRQSRWWPQLKRSYSITLESGRENYSLPQDFYAAIPETTWDSHNKWPAKGPLSDGVWTARKFGYVVVENRRGFRVFGPDINPSSGGGQFQINPTPADGDAGLLMLFEYISLNWICPKLWQPGTVYATGERAFSNGNNYIASIGGTSGTSAPTVRGTVGKDGGVYWSVLTTTAWATNTAYAAGSYVTNGGSLYLCQTGGVSAGGGAGPSGTTDNITDNTAVWAYIPADTWIAQHDYSQGDVIDSGNFYRAINGGKSGNVTPNWIENQQADNSVTWDYIDAPYDMVLEDTDLCLFDDELMILGVKWKFLQAKGAQYQDLRSEYEFLRNAAVARYQPGGKISLASEGFYPAGLYLNVPLGSFTF